MTAFEWTQTVGVIGSAIFIAYQAWLMRRAAEEQRNEAKVQSYLKVWLGHIQTCHLPIATVEPETARALNSMSPYHNLELEAARACHFADATLDFYECIRVLSGAGILDPEVDRVWTDSVPYELRNPKLREHWRTFHSSATPKPDSNCGIYHESFAQLVETFVKRFEAAEKSDKSTPTRTPEVNGAA